ncbi:MAG: hypothetical protein U1E10_02440 [Bdellovibrionales bacterium]|nr:hypothetical protein [Bdellovibrionales bacterium]
MNKVDCAQARALIAARAKSIHPEAIRKFQHTIGMKDTKQVRRNRKKLTMKTAVGHSV